MKAIQITEFGTADVLTMTDLDQSIPQPGEILVKVESASVNYSDILRRSGAIYPFPTDLPFIPGGEVAGTVEALGEGVTQPAIGTPVIALIGERGYAQYVAVPAAQVIPIPGDMSYDVAAALPIAGTTALLLLRETVGLQAGDSILIQGAAGGVGSYAVQMAKAMGAGTIIGATSHESKFGAVLSNGADHALDYSQPDWPEAVQTLTDGQGVDVILEMQGGDSFTQSLKCLAPFGRIAVYGMASGTPLSLDAETIVHFFYRPSLNQSIHVFNLGLWLGMRGQEAGKAMGDMIGMVASGQVNVPVETVLPLSQAADAHRMIEARQTTGKVILKPWLG